MTTFRLRQRTYPDHVLTVYSSMAHVTWKSSGPMCGGVGRILRPDLCMSVSSWPQVPLLGLSSVYPDRQELGGGELRLLGGRWPSAETRDYIDRHRDAEGVEVVGNGEGVSPSPAD